MDSVPKGVRQRKRTTAASALSALAMPLLIASCGGRLSTLTPAGRGAEQIADLFWWMAGGAVLIWVLVVATALYAIALRPPANEHGRAKVLIIGGGVVFPTVVLAILLAYGLSLLPGLLEPAPEGSLQIAVSGEQWWWRVRYMPPDARPFELANEIRLPVGQPVEFLLESPDVIHSFWIPSLGGKVDMIPGRRTRLKLEPTKTGMFRGACAEYCGASHALMAFDVVVLERQQFDQWMQAQARPATPPSSALPSTGQRIFSEAGCGACHTIRGTEANGVVGPDLSHVGSRLSLAAGTLENSRSELARWISETDTIKPGAHMPAFGMLPKDEIVALATYLDGLE